MIIAHTPEIVNEHWRFLILSWLGFNVLAAMPSPSQSGFTSTWIYKWAFGFCQIIKGSIPRVIATVFPQAAKVIPGMQQENVTAQNQDNIDTTGSPNRPPTV
jgi:hypothetical protein